MSKRTFRISICVIAAVIMALIGMTVREEHKQTWDVCYEMANQHINY